MRIEQLRLPREFLLLTNVTKFYVAFLGLDIWTGGEISIYLSPGEHIAWEASPSFNLVIICDISQLDEATTALKKCFDEVERAYWYNNSVQTGA